MQQNLFADAAARLSNPIPAPLRWAGSKAQLVHRLKLLFPSSYGTFIEPFVGSGALFFHALPNHAVLSDTNLDLINFYEILRDELEALIAELDRNYFFSPDHYYSVRALRVARLTPVQRAARFYFLNRYCWNGLYRVNRNGEFNVPVGKFKSLPPLYDRGLFERASLALRGHLLVRQDFRRTLDWVKPGDLVYADPPYDVESNGRAFQEYSGEAFSRTEQITLASELIRLVQLGAYVIASNSDTLLTRRLYLESGLFEFREASVKRTINSRAERRKDLVQELILVSSNLCQESGSSVDTVSVS